MYFAEFQRLKYTERESNDLFWSYTKSLSFILSLHPTTDMLIEKRTFQMQQYQYNNTWDMRVCSMLLNV